MNTNKYFQPVIKIINQRKFTSRLPCILVILDIKKHSFITNTRAHISLQTRFALVTANEMSTNNVKTTWPTRELGVRLGVLHWG